MHPLLIAGTLMMFAGMIAGAFGAPAMESGIMIVLGSVTGTLGVFAQMWYHKEVRIAAACVLGGLAIMIVAATFF